MAFPVVTQWWRNYYLRPLISILNLIISSTLRRHFRLCSFHPSNFNFSVGLRQSLSVLARRVFFSDLSRVSLTFCKTFIWNLLLMVSMSSALILVFFRWFWILYTSCTAFISELWLRELKYLLKNDSVRRRRLNLFLRRNWNFYHKSQFILLCFKLFGLQIYQFRWRGSYKFLPHTLQSSHWESLFRRRNRSGVDIFSSGGYNSSKIRRKLKTHRFLQAAR